MGNLQTQSDSTKFSKKTSNSLTMSAQGRHTTKTFNDQIQRISKERPFKRTKTHKRDSRQSIQSIYQNIFTKPATLEKTAKVYITPRGCKTFDDCSKNEESKETMNDCFNTVDSDRENIGIIKTALCVDNRSTSESINNRVESSEDLLRRSSVAEFDLNEEDDGEINFKDDDVGKRNRISVKGGCIGKENEDESRDNGVKLENNEFEDNKHDDLNDYEVGNVNTQEDDEDKFTLQNFERIIKNDDEFLTNFIDNTTTPTKSKPKSKFHGDKTKSTVINKHRKNNNLNRLFNETNDDIKQKEEITLKNNEKQTNHPQYPLKSAEEIRRSFLAKLIYKNIWTPTIKHKDHNNIIIFDWDDTLLCTTSLTPNGMFSGDTIITESQLQKFKKIEALVVALLTLSINYGDTFIITNAAPGWVEYSARRFYPDVFKLLNKIKIISARGLYERKFPGDSRQWKIQTFLDMSKYVDVNLVTNILCLGDSIIEMEAAHILAQRFKKAFIKTVKFRESPKPEDLIKQLVLLNKQFPTIFSVVKNLTIRVEKKSKKDLLRKN